jgi:inner membrane protein
MGPAPGRDTMDFMERMRSSQTLRLITVGLLVLLLQIPIAMIGGQVYERQQRGESRFGVDFLNPVDHYRMAERSVKYAALFILLTFATLWLFEVRAGVRVHPIQFLMLGGALCLFYLLLLALSEHVVFALAYAIASVAVIGMVAAYGVVVLRGVSRAAAVATGVAMLYAYLYVLLVNEDYALLMGSIGLFLILGLIMYATRGVDWYSVGRTAK